MGPFSEFKIGLLLLWLGFCGGTVFGIGMAILYGLIKL